MKVCTVGIGGCGGKVAERILACQDIFGEYIPGKIPFLKFDDSRDFVSFGGTRGLWIEAAEGDAKGQRFFKAAGGGRYPIYIIPKDSLQEVQIKHISTKYGFDITQPGFFSKAEPLKAICEILDGDQDLKKQFASNPEINPLNYIWGAVSKFAAIKSKKNDIEEGTEDDASTAQDSLCNSIMFIVSHGGGTGTGFINPITKKIKGLRSGFPVFVLGLLTCLEEKSDRPPEQRALSAMISLYDLLTGSKGVDGISFLTLMDNQILLDKFDRDYDKVNEYVFEVMKPFLEQREFPRIDDHIDPLNLDQLSGLDRSMPSIMVPCYASSKDSESISSLIDRAIENPLFPCDPKRADMAFIFARGCIDKAESKNALLKHLSSTVPLERIKSYRRPGDGKRDVLILLRDPYGGMLTPLHGPGPLEKKMDEFLELAIKYLNGNKNESNINYIIPKSYPEESREALWNYFFGKDGLIDMFRIAQDRLRGGEKPIFDKPLTIFNFGARANSQIPSVSTEALTIENRLWRMEEEMAQLKAKIGY